MVGTKSQLLTAEALSNIARNMTEVVDAHLESVWELEKRITSVPPACDAPPMPAETNEDVMGHEPLEETAARLRARMQKSQELVLLRAQIREEKILDYLMEKADVTEEPDPVEEPAAEAADDAENAD